MFSYDEPLFRPPAEAYSAIIQATLGCSWNQCAFCEMYASKRFKVRPIGKLIAEIEALSRAFPDARKVFLADGDAFVLSAGNLLPILQNINRCFGRVQRVSAYSMPRHILSKTDDELRTLRENGLKLLYIGIETGDDELLSLINKGETSQSSIDGIRKTHDAGIDTSIMIINGLGGKQFSHQHAVNSARVINRINPKFLSTLTLSMPYGESHFRSRFQGEYYPLTVVELFEELRLFLGLAELNNVIYRSNHVSNNLILGGTFPKDKESILDQIDRAIEESPRGQYPVSPSIL